MNIDDKMLAIHRLVPGASVTLRGDQIIWHDQRPQPTDEQISAALQDVVAEEAQRREAADNARQTLRGRGQGAVSRAEFEALLTTLGMDDKDESGQAARS